MSRSRIARLVVSWLVAAYLARMFVAMGMVKFDPDGFWTAAFERWGYPEWLRVLVGGLEVGGAVAALVPWLATYGASAVAVVMAGAWVTRLMDGRLVDVAFVTLYLLAMVWVAWEWRDWRWPRSRAGARPKPSASDP